jgi:ubiquitin-protein ligase
LKIYDGFPKVAPLFVVDKVKGEALVHLNVFSNGQLCIPLIHEKNWLPQTTLSEIVNGIDSIYHNPNIDDPANNNLKALSP